MQPEKTPKQLIEELYALFSSFKNRMEDPNFVQVENMMNQLMENQLEMKQELRDLKKKLLDPDNGVVVQTNKNTSFRKASEEAEKEWAEKRQELIEEHRSLVRFKSNAIRVGVALLTTLGGVITFLLNKVFA
jgi:hypothetical protein